MNSPDLTHALGVVGTGEGFGSLLIGNGRSRIGHIRCERIGGALCGADKRMADHYDTDCDNDDDEFPAWLSTNWELGICRTCVRSLLKLPILTSLAK